MRQHTVSLHDFCTKFLLEFLLGTSFNGELRPRLLSQTSLLFPEAAFDQWFCFYNLYSLFLKFVKGEGYS